MKKYFTFAQAGKAIGISRSGIQDAVNRGRIPVSAQAGHIQLLDPADVYTYRDTRSPGRPSKVKLLFNDLPKQKINKNRLKITNIA